MIRRGQVVGLWLALAVLVGWAHGTALAQGVPANLTWSGPITITKGGTYSGNWESQDPTKPAIMIMTNEAVVIQNCNIRSKGHLVQTPLNFGNTKAADGTSINAANVTIRNCKGWALNPNVKGQTNGNFYATQNETANFIFENNFAEGVSCLVTLNTRSGTPSTWQPINIRYNQVLNVVGFPSDGNGGRDLPANPILVSADGKSFDYTPQKLDGGTYRNGNFQAGAAPYCGPTISFADSRAMPSVDVAWNEFVNQPWAGSPGDQIDFWRSSGTAATPIRVHDNFMFGGYPMIPGLTANAAGWLVADCSDQDDVNTTTAFLKFYNNQIAASSGYIGIGNGHDQEAFLNRVVNTGQLPDGTWYANYVGVQVRAYCRRGPSVDFNNWAHDNYVANRFKFTYDHPLFFSGDPYRGDYQLPDCASGAYDPNLGPNLISKLPLPSTSLCTNNVSLPEPVTANMEFNEFQLWQQKLAANKIQIGPVNATPQTGWWWSPLEPGRGYSLELSVASGNIFFAAYMYDASGAAIWYVATLSPQGGNLYQGDLVSYAGGATLNGAFKSPSGSTTIAKATLTLTSATTGWLQITGAGLADTAIGIKRYTITSNGLSSPTPLRADGSQDPSFAKKPPVSSLSVPATATQPQSGWWWNPAEAGRGYFIETQAGTVFAALYMYDTNGKSIWYATGNPLTTDTSFSGALAQYGNGQVLGGAYKGASTVNSNLGNVALAFTTPTTGTLTLPNGTQVPIQRYTF